MHPKSQTFEGAYFLLMTEFFLVGKTYQSV